MPAARTISAPRKSGKDAAPGGGQEEQRADSHGEQTDDHGALVAGHLDDLAGG